MDRPVYLRQDAFDEISAKVMGLTDAELHDVLRRAGYAEIDKGNSRKVLEHELLDRPSRFLVRECSLLSRADLLADLYIEFDDDELDAGVTYYIDAEAAAEIAANDSTVLLKSGSEGVLVPLARIERALSGGCVIDYADLKT